VFQEVSDTVGLCIFESGTSVNPDTDGSGLEVGVSFGSDGETVRQTGHFGLRDVAQRLGVGVADRVGGRVGGGQCGGSESPSRKSRADLFVCKVVHEALMCGKSRQNNDTRDQHQALRHGFFLQHPDEMTPTFPPAINIVFGSAQRFISLFVGKSSLRSFQKTE
jgi:hypothetical protein